MIKLLVRSAVLDDIVQLHTMKQDPELIYWSGFADAPDATNLKKWLDRTATGKHKIFVGLIDDRLAGYVHFTVEPDANRFRYGVHALSYALAAFARGKGFAHPLLVGAMGQIGGQFRAWIAESNARSDRVATKSGLYPTDIFKDERFRYPEPRIERMRLWQTAGLIVAPQH